MSYYVNDPTSTYAIVDASQQVLYTYTVPSSSIPTNPLVSYYYVGIPHQQIFFKEEYSTFGCIMVCNPQQIYSPLTYALQDSIPYSSVQAEKTPNDESLHESGAGESRR